MEARRACQIPQDGSYRWFWASMWALETEHEQRELLTAESSLQPQDSAEGLVWCRMTASRRKKLKQRDFSRSLPYLPRLCPTKTKRKKEDPVHITVLASPVLYVIPHTHRTPIHTDTTTTTIMVRCLLKGEDSCLFILWSYGGDSLVISPMLMV